MPEPAGQPCTFSIGASDLEGVDDYDGFDCPRRAREGEDECPLHSGANSWSDVRLFVDDGKPLDGARLEGIELPSDLDLEDRSLVGANLSNADVSNVRLIGADLRGVDLDGAFLASAKIWNTDLTGATLNEADLEGAILTNAVLDRASLGQVNLRNAKVLNVDARGTQVASADLEGADLRNSRFKDADLGDAEMSGADLADVELVEVDLRNTSLTGADLTNARLEEANLERADLSRAKLFQAELERVRLHGALLTDVQVNEGTQISMPYESEQAWGKAASCWQRLERLMQANADTKRRWRMARKRHEIRRTRLREERAWLRWAMQTFWKWTSGYGSSPRRVAISSLALIVGCALAYPAFGLVLQGQEVLGYAKIDGLSQLGFTLFESLYFSAITFTTVGYGEIVPANPAAQGLATIETTLGAFLMALFVFVLGRRAT